MGSKVDKLPWCWGSGDGHNEDCAVFLFAVTIAIRDAKKNEWDRKGQ
jgi:hypothetical protein